ncbi:reverse transcriptase [Phytophthora megakarya]|uniref:Reverse transcriptase n=1 Tax=Phytophthora megakarya TaxID=4795 RepID=A0A225VHR3_9STRA|nr:reverse transcriptase [Phytophthora megakarya]
MNYEADQSDLLFYYPTTKEAAADRDKFMRVVVPEKLQQDILHDVHTSVQGSHHRIGRTYDRIRDYFHWRGLDMWDNVLIVKRAKDDAGSRVSHPVTYPFQIISMDDIPSLPRSFNGNTELLIFVDQFSGYVIAKASTSRSAQTIADTYEQCVFRRFGASEVIQNDREPGFMSDFFKSFNKILGQRRRATMAYRPQANGSAERMFQTTTRALKMYVQDLDQRDWDEYAERLTFAINTARDLIRGETPFYMIHGWDPRSTLEAVIAVGSTRRYDRDPRWCRYQMQKYYRGWIKSLVVLRSSDAKKRAHLWHGPFCVAEKMGEYAVRLEIAGSTYSSFPVGHVSKIKLIKIFPDRPVARLEVSDTDRVDFDEALLPDDSWIQGRDPDEYEVGQISDMRTG